MDIQQSENKLQQSALAKCSTGIQGLDEITNGGLPQGRPTLICGRAGCGKTLMAMEFLVRGAEEYSEPGLFVSFEESAAELTTNVASLGWDLAALSEKRLLAISCIRINRHEIQETGDYDLEALFVRLGYEIDAIAAKRVVLDTLEVLLSSLENYAIARAELQRLFLWLKSKGVTAIITSESGDNTIARHGLEEYVSDCVIRLDQRISNEISTRCLQIIKYRGSRHGTNEYPFLIKDNGISVLPITSIGLDYVVSSDRVSSGIKELDIMLGGQGFYRGSSVLISGTSGTGKSSLAAHFAHATCQQGEKCLYLAFEESTQQIIRNMRSINLDLEPAVSQGLLRFKALRPTFYGLEMHLATILDLVREFQPHTVIIDPISNLSFTDSEDRVKLLMIRLIDTLKMHAITTLLTSLTTGGNPLETTEVGVSSLMDAWLLLRDTETNGERNRLLYILKARGMEHSNQVREFRLSSKGVRLLDAYLGTAGVLTGTARLVQEAKEKAESLSRRQKIEQKQREIQRKHLLLSAQIQALQAQFEIEREEIEKIIEQEETEESVLLADRSKRARARYSQAPELTQE